MASNLVGAAGPAAPPREAPALSLRGVRFGYPTSRGLRVLVDATSFELPTGSFALVLGPSGSGKSSLVTALLGLDDPFDPRLHHTGELRILGARVHDKLPRNVRAQVGAVFQDGALLDELSPTANVALAVRAAGAPIARVGELLARVRLHHPPRQVAALSGGERRRLALARALARDPTLLVLDEPTAGLDDETAARIARLIHETHDQAGEGTARTRPRTTIVVTHDLATFRGFADSFLMLDPRRGTLEKVAPYELDAALARVESGLERVPGPPAIQPMRASSRIAHRMGRALLSLTSLVLLVPTALRHLVPVHPAMLGRSLLDLIAGMASYHACATAAGGALVTSFVLLNNPLEAGFRREVLGGVGAVLVNSFLPLLVALLFAARGAAGAAARLGSLRQARVFEALPLMGIAPPAFLLTPLLIGSLVACTALTALGIVTGLLTSLLATIALTDLSSFAWAAATFSAVEAADLRWVLGKALGSGALTALIAYERAARRKDSARAVASATEEAIVRSTLAILVLHGVLTLIQYRG